MEGVFVMLFKINSSVLGLVFLAFFSLFGRDAEALSFSATGDLGSRIDDNGYNKLIPALGLEITHPVGPIEMGLFYERDFYTYSGGTDMPNFYGIVGRVVFPQAAKFFGDLRFGVNSETGTGKFDSAFAYAIGIGYTFSLNPTLDIAPRFGFKDLRVVEGGQASGAPQFEVGFLLSYKAL
jgi:hypothetical protein